MSKSILLIFCIAAIIPSAAISAAAQDKRATAVAAANDKYVISAKAGGVNFVEGAVTIVRRDGASSRLLRRDEVNVGDRVSTGADGKAEVLLNPGSYVRLGPNSEFEFKTTSLSNLQIQLHRGSAIFEVFASHEFVVRVFTPNAKMLLVDTGVFRVNVLANGGAEIAVWQGKALLNDGRATLVKKGSAAVVNTGAQSQIRKITNDDKDELALWSKTRGKELAKQSSKLQDRAMRDALLTSFNRGGWGMYNSFGLWVWNSFTGGYSFLPFGWDWRSPYGQWYSNCIWNYNLPNYIIYPPVRTGGGTPTAGPQIRPSSDRVEPLQAPPFERIQRTMSNSSTRMEGGPSMIPGTGPMREQVYTPSVPSVSPARSAPVDTPPPAVRTLTRPGTPDN